MDPFMDDERRILEINPDYASFPTIPSGWIYIAIDMRDLRFSKIGLTTKEAPSQRVAEGRTYNPFLALFTTYELAKCTFGISREELRDIEGNIHRRGSVFGPACRHMDSGRYSEWFNILPFNAESHVDWTLARRGFSVENEALYAVSDGSHSMNGIHIQTMRKIKRVFRPFASDVQRRVEHAGYDANLIAPYLSYLEEFHSFGHPDQIWL
jgi:hypothetical protein